METQGIILWAKDGSDSLIVWCADNSSLVYVADRRRSGDINAALSVGDLVDLRVQSVGAMRVGFDLRFRGSGAGWVLGELGRARAGQTTSVISPDARIAQAFAFEGPSCGAAVATAAANSAAREGPGAA